jgi:hypothetical protein
MGQHGGGFLNISFTCCTTHGSATDIFNTCSKLQSCQAWFCWLLQQLLPPAVIQWAATADGMVCLWGSQPAPTMCTTLTLNLSTQQQHTAAGPTPSCTATYRPSCAVHNSRLQLLSIVAAAGDLPARQPLAHSTLTHCTKLTSCEQQPYNGPASALPDTTTMVRVTAGCSCCSTTTRTAP